MKNHIQNISAHKATSPFSHARKFLARYHLRHFSIIIVLNSLFIANSWASEIPAARHTGDEAVAHKIASEMKKNAGQQGATRVAAKYFSDQLESRHYPPSPGDGMVSGPQVAKAINGSLAVYKRLVNDYSMDEKVSRHGNKLTIIAFTSGTHQDETPFNDISLVTYQVNNGRITRADAIHTNPGAIQKAHTGSDDRNMADHIGAKKIADEILASDEYSLAIAQKYFSDKIAVWSSDHIERSALYDRSTISTGIASRITAIKQPQGEMERKKDIRVLGNQILVDSIIEETSNDEHHVQTSSHFKLFVTNNTIIGIEFSGSNQGPFDFP
ncbi:MAG: hypothetical protein VR73_15355 [Gammaproteobacteria bacterium BRH_c0]|nr:MAG: hypothetical protein VR73_15355 [Gammaproteobacteria bacterium BRH_c0]